MLKNLSIRNYLLLKEVDVDFEKGFSVLTGQTGSGKSIFLDALEVVLGQKAVKKDIVKILEKDSSISICFDVSNNTGIKKFLSDQSLLDEGRGSELFIRRVMKKNGTTKIYINDNIVSATTLKSLGRLLLDYNSQGDQFRVLNKGSYRNLIDQYGKHSALLEELADIYKRFIDAKDQYNKLKELELNRQKEIEYLSHNILELNQMNVLEGEEEELDKRRRDFLELEKTKKKYSEVIGILSARETSISDQILKAIKALNFSYDKKEEMEQISSSLEAALDALQNAETLIKEKLDDYVSEDIDQIQERLFKIREVARKHNCLPSELVKKLNDFRTELARLENLEEECGNYKNLYKEYHQTYLKLASHLSERRREAASILSKKITQKLALLDLGKARFSITVDYRAETVAVEGSDSVSFDVSMNPGLPLASVDSVASGGELSRFLLAMKSVFAEHLPVSVLVFDEIDSGVSGAVASAIGKEMKCLSKSNQLLVVTHSPQVIICSDNHYLVEKLHSKSEDSTSSSVRLLDSSEQKEEVARILSGQEITDKARHLADEMLEK